MREVMVSVYLKQENCLALLSRTLKHHGCNQLSQALQREVPSSWHHKGPFSGRTSSLNSMGFLVLRAG